MSQTMLDFCKRLLERIRGREDFRQEYPVLSGLVAQEEARQMSSEVLVREGKAAARTAAVRNYLNSRPIGDVARALAEYDAAAKGQLPPIGIDWRQQAGKLLLALAESDYGSGVRAGYWPTIKPIIELGRLVFGEASPGVELPDCVTKLTQLAIAISIVREEQVSDQMGFGATDKERREHSYVYAAEIARQCRTIDQLLVDLEPVLKLYLPLRKPAACAGAQKAVDTAEPTK